MYPALVFKAAHRHWQRTKIQKTRIINLKNAATRNQRGTSLILMKSINKIKDVNKKAKDLSMIESNHGVSPMRDWEIGVTLSKQVGEIGRNVRGVRFSFYELFRN